MIYIYAPDADDFECMGLCGALVPTRCEHEERAGGLSELTLEHPLDDLGRFRMIQAGCVLKAPVPVRTTPEILDGGQVVTSVEIWRTRSTASKAERYLYTKPNGGKKYQLLPIDLQVTVVLKQGDWFKVKAGSFGSGWIHQAALELVIEATLPEGSGGIEATEPAFSVREQLFRIYEIEQTDQGLIARARHISYDLLGNITSYKADQPTAVDALRGIMDGCERAHDFVARTDMADKRTEVCYEHLNPIKALLDPEVGFVSRWGAQLVRDNFELYFLRNAGLDRGVRIEHGKNLLGVRCTLNQDSAVTGILPIGEDGDGRELLLEPPIIESPRADLYPTPRVQVLNVPGAKVTKSVSLNLAKTRMREAAQAQFDAGCDLPTVSLSVDFVKLGDAEGYAEYKRLEDVFLYDYVTVSHKALGIELRAQVARTRFDCLGARFLEVELGSAQGDMLTGTIATWQVPGGFSGGKILPGSINGSALSSELIQTRHLVADSVTADQIQANTFTAQKIVAAVSELISANIRQAQIGEAHIEWADVANLNALIAGVAKAQITHANINEANIDWAQITRLSANIAQIAQAQLTTAKISEAQIDWAQIGSLQSAVAEIAQASLGNISVDYAKLIDMVTGSAIITEGVAGQLYINRLAVTEANMVCLTVGELVIKKDDGRFYTLSVGEDGEVVAVPKPIEGADIGDASLPGSKLIEGSITARELNVQQIFASNVMAQRVRAANIDVADLFASSASFGKVTANHISADARANLDLTSNRSIRAMTATDYLKLDGDGVTIGKNDADSHFQVNIKPNAVNVLQDGVPIAYFKGNKLHAFEADVQQTLTMGDWAFEVEGGGLNIYRI